MESIFLNGTISLHYEFLVYEVRAKEFCYNREGADENDEEDSDDFRSGYIEALTGFVKRLVANR